MSHEEIEVKFLLDDLTAMRQRLLSMGATLATPRTYEDNLCFDTPDQRQEGLRMLSRPKGNLRCNPGPS